MPISHVNSAVQWYMDEMTSQIVADSGIPSDRYHMGKIILYAFKQDPDLIHQIDGGTGEQETAGSILKRSIQCARSFTKLGLKKGDLIVLIAPNHLDLGVPFYASTYLGIIVSPVDRTLGVHELTYTFKINKPKMIFCQSDKISDIEEALKHNNMNAKIIQFDKTGNKTCFSELLDEDGDIDSFTAVDYDPVQSIGFLIPTSGSTGTPKFAAITYKTLMITGPTVLCRFTKFPTPFRFSLVLAPLQWLAAFANFAIGAYLRYTRLQTSKPVTEDHVRYLINTYRPSFTGISPTMISTLLKPSAAGICDFTCFEMLFVGGSAVHKELLKELNIVSPNTVVVDAFGLSELTTLAFQGQAPRGSCGKPMMIYQYRLINIETQRDINDPNVPGELWIKGPMFSEYYNDPKTTKEAFSEDGWFKTGDMLYRDQDWNYYYVERIKIMLKYKSYQISPVEVENIIRQHPGVLDVAVTGIPDKECGDLPVACVVTRPGHTVTAHEIKDLVKGTLSDAKQLRGGVIFLEELPVVASTKINRKKLKELVQKIKTQ